MMNTKIIILFFTKFMPANKRLIACLVLLFPMQIAQAFDDRWGNPAYKKYTKSEGLADNYIFTIMQDKTGIMWFGTPSGLSRFDGNTFSNFHANKGKKGISHTRVEKLLQDSQGYIWVATRGGLNRMDPRTEEFQSFLMDKNDTSSISDNSVYALYETAEGELWIGTGYGLNLFKPKTESFERFSSPFEGAKENVFTTIAQAKDGNLLIGSYRGGLLEFDKTSKTFKKIKLGLYQQYPNARHINTMWLDKKNRLWMATGAGLVEFNMDTKQSMLHTMQSKQQEVFTIYIDSSNQLWAGFYPGGLCRFNTDTHDSYCLSQETLRFPGTYISAIYQNLEGILWVGTEEGLVYFNPNNPFRLIRFNQANHSVWAINKDHVGRLWVGTQTGIIRVDKNKQVTYYNNTSNNNRFGSVSYIFINKDNQIWVSTEYGLYLYDPHMDRMQSFDIKVPDSHNPIWITSITENDSSELLLSTTGHGLLRWDKTSQYATEISHNFNSDKETLLNITGSFLDPNGRHWSFGYRFLSYLDQQTNELTVTELIKDYDDLFIHMTMDEKKQLWLLSIDGLYKASPIGKIESRIENNTFGNAGLYSITATDNHLWIGATNGMWQFNPYTNKTIKHFTEEDGLQSNDFVTASYLDSDGTIFLGGNNGITIFHPDDLKSAQHKPPPVTLTDLSINNKFVEANPADKNSPLPARLAYLDHLELNYSQSRFFSLEFSALNYYTPQKNRYAYKLNGFHDDWIYTDSTNRRATFTNLSPGDYTFHIKASTIKNHWPNNSTSLTITILPPWWRTIWAYLIYSAIFTTSLFWFIHHRTAQSRMRAAQLEHEVKLRTQELQQRTKEIHQQKKTIEGLLEKKNTLFANVSHEFRTPLTLILGPIDRVLKRNPDKLTCGDLDLAKRSTQRLQSLVEQLLLFSKLNSFESIEAVPCSVKQIIEVTVASLRSLVDGHQLQLTISPIEDVLTKLTPNDALQTIISNLLSNAIKYTPAGGRIDVNVYVDDSAKIHITVRDNGQGIPPEWQEKIFGRFSRMTKHVKTGIPGTGLGLALVKELIEINHGRISVSNAEDGGAVFEVVLPIYTPSHEEIEQYSFSEPNQTVETIAKMASTEPQPQNNDTEKPTIQIIDDTVDMRAYLYEELNEEFNLILAEDGETGLQSIKQHDPDIIICDIMMPGIDGLEVLKRLRADIEISHTPLILLTAKDDNEYRMKGYQEQADDYITKPFAADLLKARLHNILNLRKTRQKQAQIAITSASVDKHLLVQNYEASENKFLEKFKTILERHYADLDLKVNNISDKMHMSQSTLNRKIKALLGVSPYHYLRIYRLEKAAQILKAGYEGNLAKLANAVGFATQQHFSKNFKEQFGKSPKNYLKKTILRDTHGT